MKKTKGSARITRSNGAKLDTGKVKAPGMFTCDTGITPGQDDDVLVAHGAGFKIEPFTGQSHCGVIRYLGENDIIDLTKEEDEPIDPRKKVNADDAESLARDIFFSTHTATEEADVVAHAVMQIIRILADESEEAKKNRVGSGITLSNAIYHRTRNVCDSMVRFAEGVRPKLKIAE